MSLIETEDLSLALSGRTILHGISMRVSPGEIVTIVGPNGGGKSTLVRGLIGAIPAAAGRIRRRPGLRIGYVPQRLALEPTLPLSVDRFLSLAGGTRRAARDAVLERVGLAGAGRQAMATLSGGQFQRALLAHALLRAPDLLILDEAAQGLDQPGTAQFYRLIETLRAETGAAVLMVSHDLHVVMAASDRVLCVNGHVCCQGTPTVVSAAPEYRALFGVGTSGALALYRHEHAHGPDHPEHAHPPAAE